MPRRRRRRGELTPAVAIAALATAAMVAVGVAGGDGGAEFDYRKLSGIIIPGFASTQLRAWSVLDCPYSPFDYNPLDSVWLDTAKLFSAVNCWLKCMLLEPYNQTDHPKCKSRPNSGLSAISELDSGYITGNSVSGKPNNSGGDGTVSYTSLSWCKNWLGPKVNITRAPQAEHDGSDLQTSMNIEHHHSQDILPNMTRAPHVKYITYYEDAESIPVWRTAVWELDKANHRNIVRMPVLMRELWLEMWHDMHFDSKSKFVTKAFRGPLRNEDCRWDYAKARCGFPEHRIQMFWAE